MGESIMSRYPAGQRAEMKEVLKTEIIVQNKLWEVPNNCNVSRGISVRIFGGGAAGISGDYGGGSGQMNNAIFTNLTKGQLININIGAGGNTISSGRAGGTTLFGNYLSANGGSRYNGGASGGGGFRAIAYQFGGGGGCALCLKSGSFTAYDAGNGGIWGGGGGGASGIIGGWNKYSLGGNGGKGGTYGGNGGNGGINIHYYDHNASSSPNFGEWVNYKQYPTPAEDGTSIGSQTIEDGTVLVTSGKAGTFVNIGNINYSSRNNCYAASGAGGGGYGGCGGKGYSLLNTGNWGGAIGGGGGGGYGCNGGNGGRGPGGGGGGYGCDGSDSNDGGGAGGYGKSGYARGGGWRDENGSINYNGVQGICIIQYYQNELTLI